MDSETHLRAQLDQQSAQAILPHRVPAMAAASGAAPAAVPNAPTLGTAPASGAAPANGPAEQFAPEVPTAQAAGGNALSSILSHLDGATHSVGVRQGPAATAADRKKRSREGGCKNTKGRNSEAREGEARCGKGSQQQIARNESANMDKGA